MKRDENRSGLTRESCPEHGHSLVNVHKVRDGRRVVIGKTCPEPRCHYAEMSPRALENQAPIERTAV